MSKLSKNLSEKSMTKLADELANKGVGVKWGVSEQERIELHICLKETHKIDYNTVHELEDGYNGLNLIAFYKEGLQDKAEKLMQRTLDKLDRADEAEDKEQKRRQIGITKFDYDGTHYIEIGTPEGLRFLPYKNGEFYEPVASLNIPDAEEEDKSWDIMPLPQIGSSKATELFKKSAKDFVKFGGMPESYGNVWQLYCDIKSFIHKYVQLPKSDEVLATLYVMKASIYYCYDTELMPFIHVNAPFGKGKSRLLKVMAHATLLGYFTIGMRAAALKRIAELYKPAIFADELMVVSAELMELLNGRYNRDSVVTNANTDIQQGINSIIAYDIFGATVYANRESIKDDAIESKSFQISLNFELTRTDIPVNIKGDVAKQFEEEARHIRNKLMCFRVDYHDKINSIPATFDLKPYKPLIEPRLFQLIDFFEEMPTLMPELLTDLHQLMLEQIHANVTALTSTPNGMVATTLLSILNDVALEGQTGIGGYDGEFDPKKQPNQPDAALVEYTFMGKYKQGIPLAVLHEEVSGSLEPSEVGRIIKRLGLETDYPRVYYAVDKAGEDGEDKKPHVKGRKIKVLPLPDEAKVRELRLRYDLEFIEEEIAKIPADTTAGEGGEASKDKGGEQAEKGSGEAGYDGEAEMVSPTSGRITAKQLLGNPSPAISGNHLNHPHQSLTNEGNPTTDPNKVSESHTSKPDFRLDTESGNEAQASDPGTHLSEAGGTVVAGSTSSPLPGADTSTAPGQSIDRKECWKCHSTTKTTVYDPYYTGKGEAKIICLDCLNEIQHRGDDTDVYT